MNRCSAAAAQVKEVQKQSTANPSGTVQVWKHNHAVSRWELRLAAPVSANKDQLFVPTSLKASPKQ